MFLSKEAAGLGSLVKAAVCVTLVFWGVKESLSSYLKTRGLMTTTVKEKSQIKIVFIFLVSEVFSIPIINLFYSEMKCVADDWTDHLFQGSGTDRLVKQHLYDQLYGFCISRNFRMPFMKNKVFLVFTGMFLVYLIKNVKRLNFEARVHITGPMSK